MNRTNRRRTLLSIVSLGLLASIPGCGQASNTSDVPKEAQRVTQVTYMVMLFRKEHGRLPESMDEIVEFNGATPRTDDWGNEFQYEREGTEFSVYSAGPDKEVGTKDDLRASLKRKPAE